MDDNWDYEDALESPSARKVWIEMPFVTLVPAGIATSPSARKVWIEIRDTRGGRADRRRHLPQGRCGLKFSPVCDPSQVVA